MEYSGKPRKMGRHFPVREACIAGGLCGGVCKAGGHVWQRGVRGRGHVRQRGHAGQGGHARPVHGRGND